LSQPKPINLALQGGGAHGAFEWGVLDKLLEDGQVEIKAVTAASAGAMNAAVLAMGFVADGAAGARAKLDEFWRKISAAASPPFGKSGVWTEVFAPAWLRATPGWRVAQSWAQSLSPYEFNPFNFNPLRDALSATVDFAALRERSPIALYVSATAVEAGESRVFRTHELTADHLLASACLPQLFQAVVIDGEPYWDGGYLANPALWPLFYDPTPGDILIVNLNPFIRKGTPKTPAEIIDRLNEITFNSPLVAELRAVAFVQKLIEDGLLKEAARGRYRNMLIHTIDADAWLEDLGMDSKFETDWNFLVGLKDRGRRAAEAWLKSGLADVGVRSSAKLRSDYLSKARLTPASAARHSKR
jgi:NTE family protein